MQGKFNNGGPFSDALACLVIPTSDRFGTHAPKDEGKKTICTDIALVSYS